MEVKFSQKHLLIKVHKQLLWNKNKFTKLSEEEKEINFLYFNLVAY